MGLRKPNITKAFSKKTFKKENLDKIKVDIKNKEFQDERNKRVFIKNIKQNTFFIVESIPMFKKLKYNAIVKALNPNAQIPLSLRLYFGIEMTSFVTLDIFEHTFPIYCFIKHILSYNQTQVNKLVLGNCTLS